MKKILASVLICIFIQTPFVLAFELKDFDNTPHTLDEKIGNGRWTLLMFWAHDCGICKAEFPSLSTFNKQRDDVDVIGVSIDGENKKHLAQSFLDSTKPSFTSYITSLSLVAFNYRALTQEDFRGTPTFLLFSPDGELIGNNPGKLSITALENFIEKNSNN